MALCVWSGLAFSDIVSDLNPLYNDVNRICSDSKPDQVNNMSIAPPLPLKQKIWEDWIYRILMFVLHYLCVWITPTTLFELVFFVFDPLVMAITPNPVSLTLKY